MQADKHFMAHWKNLLTTPKCLDSQKEQIC